MTEQQDSGVGQAEGKSGCAGLLGGLAVIGLMSVVTTTIAYFVINALF